jgi:hypothetical protein
LPVRGHDAGEQACLDQVDERGVHEANVEDLELEREREAGQ